MLKMKSLTSLVLVAGFALAASNAFADGKMGTATIKGKVVFKGTPPATKPLAIGGDAICTAAHTKAQPDQGTIVYTKNGNTVPYAFVYLKGVKDKYNPPDAPVVIDQKDCMYHPHIIGMVAGQAMQIKNSDPTNHNIHSQAQKNPQFNFAQAQKGMVKNLKGGDTFNKEEVMAKIKCDVHAWMSSYVGVLTHPFFDVSKSHEDNMDGGNPANRGTFEIKNVPAGDYEICARHETFGTVCQKITIKDGETKDITITYDGSQKAEAPTRTVILGDVTNTKPTEKK